MALSEQKKTKVIIHCEEVRSKDPYDFEANDIILF